MKSYYLVLCHQKKRRHLIVRNYANKSSPKFCFIPSDLAVNDKRAQEELPKQGSDNKRNRLIHFNKFHAKLFQIQNVIPCLLIEIRKRDDDSDDNVHDGGDDNIDDSDDDEK